MKNKLLVSFSGGETSAYMAQWLWRNRRDEYEMIFVFANTGQENEETLRFVQRCSVFFGFPVVWVEAKVNPIHRKPTLHKVVDFLTADRDGRPYEDVIKKYGIPNQMFKHCTRELKEAPIHSYAKSIGWKDYYTAIGIRLDEMDRQNSKKDALRLLYPLIRNDMRPMTKAKINFWWSQQPFRLELKGYQGNCVWCWKKSDPKLYQIAKENPHAFDFPGKMELRYGKYTPDSRLKLMAERDELPVYPVTFFRKNRSSIDIMNEAKNWNGSVLDDAAILDDSESCEVFSECGDTPT
jgi:hypothetical protein